MKNKEAAERLFCKITSSPKFEEIYIVFDYCRKMGNYANFLNVLCDEVQLSAREIDEIDFEHLIEKLNGLYVSVSPEKSCRYILDRIDENLRVLKDFVGILGGEKKCGSTSCR
jgi:hypothetical protein